MKPVRSPRAPCRCPSHGAVPHDPAFRRFFALFLLLMMVCLTPDSRAGATSAASVGSQANDPPPVRISQVYGGGGNANAPYQNDFVELHNTGQAPVDVTGWSVQYARINSVTWHSVPLNGMIPAGGYYLVSGYAGKGCSGNTTPCGVPLPAADASKAGMDISMGGHAYLVMSQDTIGDACRTADDPLVADLVGFGSTAMCFEGDSPAPVLTNTTAALRKDNACQDENENATDFTTGAPAPHNSAAPPITCAVLAVSLATWEAQPTGSDVLLRWETVSEFDNTGFNVYRAQSAEGPWVRVNSLLIPAATPGATAGAQYTWTDAQVSPGVAYWYMLEDVALDGTATRHEPLTVTPAVPNAVGQVSAQARRMDGVPGWLLAVGALGLAAAGSGLRAGAARRS